MGGSDQARRGSRGPIGQPQWPEESRTDEPVERIILVEGSVDLQEPIEELGGDLVDPSFASKISGVTLREVGVYGAAHGSGEEAGMCVVARGGEVRVMEFASDLVRKLAQYAGLASTMGVKMEYRIPPVPAEI